MNRLVQTILTNAGVYDKSWMKFLRTWIVISALLLLLTAFVSLSDYHPDEHFQTIEFTNYKLGNIDSSQLAWEFPAHMRPWLQPFCYYILTKVFSLINITDPFVLSMFFRFFSAFFAWVMIVSMQFSAHLLFEDNTQRKAVVIVLSLLAFLPYMFVRTSSESLSSSFSMFGFALLMLGSTSPPHTVLNENTDAVYYQRDYPRSLLFVVGIVWGIAFEFRYQVAFLIAGFIFWMIFVSIKDKKNACLSVGILFCGIIVPILLCTVLDTWGYGTFTIVPWNYLYQNIFLHRAGEFGTLPFYGYIPLMLGNKRVCLMLVVILVGTVVGIIRYPKHPLSWGVAVFLLVHSIISHKELRFLMNILIPSIFLTIYAFHPKTKQDVVLNKIWKFRTSIPAKIFYAFNIGMLLIYFTALNDEDLQFCKYLYYNIKPQSTLYVMKDSPYAPWGEKNIQYNFYKPKGLKIVFVDSINSDIIDGKNEILVVDYKNNMPINSDIFNVSEVYRYKAYNIYSIIKYFIKKEKNIWTLYRVK
jgi:phosphatidylinositol glycan class B